MALTTAALATLTVAACGSSGGGAATATTGATGASGKTVATSVSACMQHANAFLSPYRTLPTTLSAELTPLASKPAPGGTIVKLVNGTLPSDQDSYTQGIAPAAKSIGWNAKEVVFDGTVEDLNSKFEQVIATKPTVIVSNGWPLASIEKPVAAARAAGIVVALDSISDPPLSYPGYAAYSQGTALYQRLGEINAYLFLADSKCAGSVAVINLPYPILKVSTDAFLATVKANCPSCKVQSNMIQSADVGSPKATNAIVSSLQSSPSTKYVYTIIGNVADGLPVALAQAGIRGVKIFGQTPDATSIQALRNGQEAWWVNHSAVTEGWSTLDVALRAIEAKKPVTTTEDPLSVLTPQNVPSQPAQPIFPLNYETLYKKLWHVA